MMFRCVGVITLKGETARREITISPPSGQGIAWALTEAVRHFNAVADEDTEHHGVWCYFT